jgi:TonB family protein
MTLTCTLLSAQANFATAQVAPEPKDTLQAHVAWLSNTTKSCPDLRVAEDGTAALVVFLVGRSGVPSRPSIKLSSQSEALDAAAINCVLRLRFQPATRLGDGEPIDSWQEIAWRWANQEHHEDPQGITTPTSTSGGKLDSTAIVAAPKESDTGGRREGSQGKDGRVAVRVCADNNGKLTQGATVLRSSGNSELDQAAVKIAESGSPYYRPGTTLDGKPVSGCAQLVIQFEAKP